METLSVEDAIKQDSLYLSSVTMSLSKGLNAPSVSTAKDKRRGVVQSPPIVNLIRMGVR